MNLKALIIMMSMACASGYKVLLVAPMPIRSLNILGVGYVRHLLNAGHEVTYVSPFPLKEESNKFRQIDLSSTHLNILAKDDSLNIGYLMMKPPMEDAEIEYIQANSVKVAEATFQNKELIVLLNDPRVTFDVVIADFIESELYAALAVYYDCPMIWAYSLGSHWPILRLIDEATNPAFASDYLTSIVPPFHSMSQRVKKLWIQLQWYYYKWFKTFPQEKAIYEKTMTPLFIKKNKPLPDYNEVIFNASLVLANDFLGNGPITSVPQNFRFIGGYHIQTPTQSLPRELKILLDNAEHGFIYFSMGSLWQSRDMPKHVIEGLINIFATIKQTVIWKYEEDLPNLPKNVHVLPWAPQQSILAHPKCLFFISHGGLLSTTESAHFGIPTIGIPIYFDQFNNVNRAVQSGRTIKVELSTNLVEELRVAIHRMTQDPTYKKRAKELSQIYHDRPVPPGKELVHWVEHVIKTRGAPHLRSPASMMPWWEKLFLDVIVLILVTIALMGLLFKKYLNRNKEVSSHRKNE